MKHKKIIIASSAILVIVIIVVCFIVFSKNKNSENIEQYSRLGQEMSDSEWQDSRQGQEMSDSQWQDKNELQENRTRKNQTTNLNETSEITSALTENVELHATYYLSAVYVEENQFVEAGTNILKYTNGTYLTAPYDCYITELNLPDIEGKCLNNHYVQIESKNVLSVTMKVDETQIDKINVGTEATIEVTAIEQEYTGYVTHIGSIASNGKFEVTIEFENDGKVLIGMTADVEITI